MSCSLPVLSREQILSSASFTKIVLLAFHFIVMPRSQILSTPLHRYFDFIHVPFELKDYK
jgi:hypothetical protein